MLSRRLFAACLLSGVSLALPAAVRPARGQTKDAPASATYTNPVYARDFPDPYILYYQGKYYAYATESGVTGFQVMDSPDLVHWTHRGLALQVPWSKVHYWAPEVKFYRGRFYMTYSALNPATNRHDIGIAVADKPSGPFTHRAVLVHGDNNRVGVIDATLFFDRDHKPYLIYSEEEPRRLVMRRLSSNLLRAENDASEVIRPDREWEHGITEAPTMLYRHGWYHLFYSGGFFQSDVKTSFYAVGHARSRSLFGPWVKDAEPILKGVVGKVYGPGHQCLIEAPDRQMWMAYHAWDNQNQPRYGSNPLGRTLRIDRLRWSGDTPVVTGPTTDPQPAPATKPLK